MIVNVPRGSTSIAGVLTLAGSVFLSALAARAQEPAAPRHLSVQASASCEPLTPACSLEAALESIAPGGTIELGAGRFPARIRLSHDVTLVGAGAGKTVLDAGGLGRVLRIDPGVNVVLRGLTITGGNLEAELERDGGGIWNLGTLLIDRCEVVENSAVDDGGGIRNDGKLTVVDSTIRNNRATRWGGVGGGIYNPVILGDPVLTVVRSTISGNMAGANGGGIWCEHEVSIVSSTISGNAARMTGGGIRNNGKMKLKDSTIAFNYAGTEGGGLRNFGEVEVSGSLIAGNGATTSGPDCHGPVISLGHNLVREAEMCLFTGEAARTDLKDVDPHLEPLADHGGPTWTHALSAESPAVNAGGGCEDLDQRGKQRRSGACDIGAFELVP